MIAVGSQILAPRGWRNLLSGQTYYFLASTPDPQRVLLVVFFTPQRSDERDNQERKAYLLAVPRVDFESALRARALEVSDIQRATPPWFPATFDAQGRGELCEATRKHVDRWEARIKPAVDTFDQWIRARRPLEEIAGHGRDAGANSVRFLIKLLTYLLFGRSKWALSPTYFECGRHDRSDLPAECKLGRPNERRGKSHGTNLTGPLREQYLAAYQRQRALGVPLCQVIVNMLTKELGFKAIEVGDGKKRRFEYHHPEGHVAPTDRQIRYLLQVTYGRDQLYIDRYGPERHRHDQQASKGSVSEHLSNLYEEVEVDAQCISRKPILPDGTELPSLWRFRLVCRTSSMQLGVGFSFGAERASGLNLALFAAAIDKVKLCSLYSLVIRPDQWPSIGIPGNDLYDRGAASYLSSDHISLFSGAESYDGQAKPMVEASHDRDDRIDGAPSRRVGRSSLVEMCATEVLNTYLANFTKTVEPSTRQKLDGSEPKPIAIWEELSSLGRNNALQIPFCEAVRKYLPKRKVFVEEASVRLGSLHFSSSELRKKSFFARIRSSTAEIYLYPMALRHVWLDVEGTLYELDLVDRYNDGLTLLIEEEAEALDREYKAAEREQEQQKHIAKAYFDQQFEEQRGKAPDRGKVVRGRASKKSIGAEEKKAIEVALGIR